MPTYSAPRSDGDRLSTLDTIFTTSGQDTVEAKLLPAAVRTKVETFLPGYRPVVEAQDKATAGRAKEVSEKDVALGVMGVHVRDFFEVLKRRTVRRKHNVSVLVHYGLPQSGDLPALDREDDIESAAAGIVAGETAAVAAGFSPMANPSAAAVKGALDAYRKESGEVSPADAAVRQAQLAAAKLRPDADELIGDVKDEIAHALRKEDGPAQRRVLRLFGFKFAPNPGETPEPQPAPTPTPAK
jgi:hypothetical protein